MANSGTAHDGGPVCPHCLAATPPDVHFCDKCGAPLTSHAATDPLGSVRASGFVYQTAAEGSTSKITLIGMWALFGGVFLLNLPAVYFSFLALLSLFMPRLGISTEHGFFTLFLLFLFVLALESLFVAILIRVTKNHRKRS